MKKTGMIFFGMVMVFLLTSCSTLHHYYIEISEEPLESIGIESNNLQFRLSSNKKGEIKGIEMNAYPPEIELVDGFYDILEDSDVVIDFELNGIEICSKAFVFQHDNGSLTTNAYQDGGRNRCIDSDVPKSFDTSNITITMLFEYTDSNNKEHKETLVIFETDDLLMYFIDGSYDRFSLVQHEIGRVGYTVGISSRDDKVTKFILADIWINNFLLDGLPSDSPFTVDLLLNGETLCTVSYEKIDIDGDTITLPNCSIRYQTDESMTIDEFGIDSFTISMQFHYNDVTEIFEIETIEDMRSHKFEAK